MKTVSTPKGTLLPLVNLKGNDYLQVAHRLQWFNEATEKFHIDTDFLLCTDEQTVARSKVTVFDKDGKEIKHATSTKRETKKDFPDHTEKAETGSIGRALALLGYGTQFALSDLDEGQRLADAPVVNARVTAGLVKPEGIEEVKSTVSSNDAGSAMTPAVKISTFRKNKPASTAYAEQVNPGSNKPTEEDNGWK